LRYRRRVTAVALRYFPDLADAEDLAQEAFVRAYTKLKTLKPGVPFEYWIMRIAANLCLDRIRKDRRRAEQPFSQLGAETGDWLDQRLNSATSDEPRGFEERFASKQLLQRVLPRIDPKDRLVLHLLYTEGRDVAEIAQILGWSKPNVKVRAFRARRVLGRAIEELLANRKGVEHEREK
jgi:RNA polymerase sigma-70 factor (ECF subfamily)